MTAEETATKESTLAEASVGQRIGKLVHELNNLAMVASAYGLSVTYTVTEAGEGLHRLGATVAAASQPSGPEVTSDGPSRTLDPEQA